MPARPETRLCLRDDGVEFPYSAQLAKRRDFRVIDRETKQVLGISDPPARASALDFTPINTSVADAYAGFDDVQLAAILQSHGVTPPDNATRDQIIELLSHFRLPSPSAAEPANEPNHGPGLEGLDALTKQQLIEKAKVDFGYEMPAALTKEQMIEQFKLLKKQ